MLCMKLSNKLKISKKNIVNLNIRSIKDKNAQFGNFDLSKNPKLND